MEKGKLKGIILAGGIGKRMNSDIPKALHKILDKTLIDCVLDACEASRLEDLHVVVGFGADKVKEALKDRNLIFCYQKEQLGTGNAVMCCTKYIDDDDTIMVVNADMPLIKKEDIDYALDTFEVNNYSAMIVSTMVNNPTGYGRIVRDENANFANNIQQKDANEEELKIKEVDLAIYCFKGKYLKIALNMLTPNNKQNEYYITDCLFHIKNLGENVGICKLKNSEHINVNSKKELAEVTQMFLKRICNKHIENGVIITSPSNTYISQDAEIGMDTVIYPGCIIEGHTKIGPNCFIGPNSRIINSNIGENVTIESSKIDNSVLENNVKIGPFANIRPGSKLGNNTSAGAYTEIKNSIIGENVKASHHLYLGDSDIGNNVEIGCGTITVNFDVYENKHRCIIEDNAFIGSNSNLVSPITVGKNAIIAAGSTITQDVANDALAIAREKQVIKEDWAKKINENKKNEIN